MRARLLIVAVLAVLLATALGPASAATTEDAAQNQKIASLETELHDVEAFIGFKKTEPPKEEPKEEPPAEQPKEEPTGTQTLHCFADPSACGYPDPGTTGATGTLTPSGSIKVTAAGSTVKGKDVTGTLVIAADNVTVEDVRVTQTGTCGTSNSCGNYAIGVAPGVTGVKLRRVTTRSAVGKTCNQDIRNGGTGLIVEDSDLEACDGSLWTYEPVTMRDTFSLARQAISSDHVENVYAEQTTFTAVHDTFLNPVVQTANIFANDNGGVGETAACKNHVTVEDSLLAGGGFSIYPCAHAGSAGTGSLVVRNNHFARCLGKDTLTASGGNHICSGGPDTNGYFPRGGSYGLLTDSFGATWQGNVWDDSGAAATP
jgi:type II secretory pathway pseudopilin PulG